MDNTQNLGQPVGKVTTTYNGEKIQVNVYADRSAVSYTHLVSVRFVTTKVNSEYGKLALATAKYLAFCER